MLSKARNVTSSSVSCFIASIYVYNHPFTFKPDLRFPVSGRQTQTTLRPETTTKRAPLTTTTSTTTMKPTTTLETTTEAENVYEGSGDLSCDDLYNYWKDQDFPGGSPPPLSPDENLVPELCDFLRKSMQERCAVGTIDNKALCESLARESDGTDRTRRHKNGQHDDDEDVLNNVQGDDAKVGDLSDLSFDDVEKPAVVNNYRVEIDSEPRPNAVSLLSEQSSISSRLSGNVYLCTSVLIVVFGRMMC